MDIPIDKRYKILPQIEHVWSEIAKYFNITIKSEGKCRLQCMFDVLENIRSRYRSDKLIECFEKIGHPELIGIIDPSKAIKLPQIPILSMPSHNIAPKHDFDAEMNKKSEKSKNTSSSPSVLHIPPHITTNEPKKQKIEPPHISCTDESNLKIKSRLYLYYFAQYLAPYHSSIDKYRTCSDVLLFLNKMINDTQGPFSLQRFIEFLDKCGIPVPEIWISMKTIDNQPFTKGMHNFCLVFLNDNKLFEHWVKLSQDLEKDRYRSELLDISSKDLTAVVARILDIMTNLGYSFGKTVEILEKHASYQRSIDNKSPLSSIPYVVALMWFGRLRNGLNTFIYYLSCYTQLDFDHCKNFFDVLDHLLQHKPDVTIYTINEAVNKIFPSSLFDHQKFVHSLLDQYTMQRFLKRKPDFCTKYESHWEKFANFFKLNENLILSLKEGWETDTKRFEYLMTDVLTLVNPISYSDFLESLNAIDQMIDDDFFYHQQ